MTIEEFVRARYGLFIHFGLYSLLERGEWVMNREEIPREEYRLLADRFQPRQFDADALARLAVRSGMRYLVFTTMHHDGFRLYDSDLTDFCSTKTAARRDFTSEIIDACRRHGLKIGLYHSLNNWMDLPDSVDALESPSAYETFIGNTFERFRELLTRYQPVDILWYDGWWPYHAEGWRAVELDQMAKSIQPHILLNGRHGGQADFATPEQHLTAPNPWRPWEACITLNGSWGYNAGDHRWKQPQEVLAMLATCSTRKGNLLLNIGPRGDGSVPEPATIILEQTGEWLKLNGEAFEDTDYFTYSLREEGDCRNDWNHCGPLTARGNCLYWLVFRWPKDRLTLGGVQTRVSRVSLLDGNRPLEFLQAGTRLQILGIPDRPPSSLCNVIKIDCEEPPRLYQCGGIRRPSVPHPHYDPAESDIQD